eukprot:CAMPEP_0197251138 /NCGR_PEP_ID=MMETSP1429-20130617/55925_1 /TAXON_ID=49237 /ORGANISM="Chaetoceros  sp., Strain UNC1202" /LENGTH=131 /DNA_ID=CAMNT_0042713141 /DNA_START=26 /DNA_END=421 /DNA_ORIENTATION=-
MTDLITKAVKTVSAVHMTKKSGLDGFRSIFFSPRHFPKILSASMFGSCIAGYLVMDSLHQTRIEERDKIYAYSWENHKMQKDRHNEKYETALRPSSLQKRRLTRSETVVFLSPTLTKRSSNTFDRVRLAQE